MRGITGIGIGRRCTSIAFVIVVLMALAAPSAQAGKGWAPQETFGSANQPTFGEDRALAIDRASGDLLVYDSENLTLSRWHADGTPSNFSALGTNVIDGKRTGAVNECPTVPADCDETPGNAGIAGFIREQIAIDNSGTATDGNIYITSFFGPIDIFSEAGVSLGRLTQCGSGPSFAGTEGVGVDEAGNVYVSAFEHGINKYDPSTSAPLDQATDADCVATALPEFFPGNVFPGNVVAGAGPSAGDIFAVKSSNPGIVKLDFENLEVEYEFGSGFGRQLALDPLSGHVFHKQDDLGWTEYDASGPSAESVEVVSSLQDAGSEVQGLAVAEGGETLYVSLAGTPNVQVYEAVPVPEATTGPPSVVSGAKATVTGTVNPEGAGVTGCFFEFGKTTAYGQEAPCEEYESGGVWVPLNSPNELGTGSDPVPVRGELTGLLAQGTTYHYRLVAKSADGQDEGDDKTFVTADTFFTDPATNISESEATLNGRVKPEGVALTDCRFEWGKTTEYGQEAACNPAAGAIPNDDAEHPVSAVISGLEASTVYHFRLIAENSLGQIVAEERTFATQGAPGIDAQVASALGRSSATLQALVNPFGTETTYHFEWGVDASYGNRIPAGGELSAGSGSDPVLVSSAELPGLAAASEYHFRVVAINSFGTTAGPDHRFETLNEHGLPDNRGFEMVTPADKGPSGSISGGLGAQATNQAAVDGDSFLWPLQNGMPESTVGGWSRWLGERQEQGWLSTQISGPSLITPPGIDGFATAEPNAVLYASADLSCGVLKTYNPLTPDTLPSSIELGVENLYVWREDGGQVSYELITDRVPLNPAAKPAGVHYSQIETAEDCSRVYFRTPSDSYVLIAGASGLYEWDGETLRDAGVLPDGSVGEDLKGNSAASVVPAVAGGEVDSSGSARWNAVSPGGRRFFFTAIANEGPSAGTPAVFMREDGGAPIEISGSETAVATNGARFEAASPDGSRVFFRANYGIDAQTSSAGATDARCGPQGSGAGNETVFDSNPPLEAKNCDLYAYEVETGELSDLSADTADPTGAQIQGTVAVDEDGSHVYFAALGQLVPGEGRTYARNLAGDGSANVYLARPGGLAYVTTLTRGNASRGDHDLFLGATMRTNDTGTWTAETSADGEKLLFESTSRLTWYDNIWENPKGELDGRGKVAYLYSADTGEIECVSCRHNGQPTLVGPDGKVPETFLDAPKLLASRGRSMSEDGSRVFFTSPDALMPGAEAGKRNVYEWEEGQPYFLAVAERAGGFFLSPPAHYEDASASGDSAFLSTDRQLAPQDRDFVTDIYAVRVDGGFDVEAVPPECQVDEAIPLEANQIYCQGERTPPPGDLRAGQPPGEAGIACPKGKLPRGGRCLSKRQIAQRRCRKVDGREAKRRCVRKQLRRLNRAAKTNRGGAK